MTRAEWDRVMSLAEGASREAADLRTANAALVAALKTFTDSDLMVELAGYHPWVKARQQDARQVIATYERSQS